MPAKTYETKRRRKSTINDEQQTFSTSKCRDSENSSPLPPRGVFLRMPGEKKNGTQKHNQSRESSNHHNSSPAAKNKDNDAVLCTQRLNQDQQNIDSRSTRKSLPRSF
ncbi:unnamed protein product, partial [Ectocarpus sp. 8 AP-2014]